MGDLKKISIQLDQLSAYQKKTALLPNSRQKAAVPQAFIEGALVQLGLDPDKVSAEVRADMQEKSVHNIICSC